MLYQDGKNLQEKKGPEEKKKEGEESKTHDRSLAGGEKRSISNKSRSSGHVFHKEKIRCVKLESIVFACVEDRGVVMMSGAEMRSPVTRVNDTANTSR